MARDLPAVRHIANGDEAGSRDGEGNASQASLVVFRDVAAPAIAITTPSNNAIFASASVTVTGTATDDIAV